MRKKLLFCLKKTWTCMAGILLLFFCGFNARSQSIDINGYPDDWCAVLNNADIIKVWVIDANNTNDDSFQKGKDEDWVKDWVWVDGNTNDKGDITNAGAAVIGDYLYFFGDRTAINGDAYIGFWILQDPVKKTYTPVPKGSGFMFSGEHVDGDLLVITNFTNGGGQVTLHIYKWLGGSVVPVATTPDAMVNDIDVVLPTGCSPAWTYSGKLCNAGYYCKGAFIEGKIYIGDKDLCSSSFMLETRNSPAIDASRQDFALGEFNMTPDPPVMVGDADCAPNPELTLAVKDPVSGLTYKWYDKETSGTLVHTGVSWTKTFDKTTDYWVTATFMKCESSGTKVTATVWSKPELTLKGTNLLCFEDKTGKIEVS